MKIPCLECGKLFNRPASHVWQVHKLTARAYKELHGLDVKRGIATDEYRERMRAHVLSNGTIDNLKAGARHRFRKGDTANGKYTRSEQTTARLKTHFEKIANRQGRSRTVAKVKINCAQCGKEREIYPRAYRLNNNYCGITCRNRANNLKK